MTANPPPMHLLIISGGRDLPDRARALWPGLRTSVICRPEVLPRVRSKDQVTRLLSIREDAPVEEWLAAARFIHAVDPIDRIANYSEKDTEHTAAIAEDLGLSWHSTRTLRAVNDKTQMRHDLAEAGLGGIAAAAVTTKAEVEAFAAAHGYPLICKPVRGTASKGVTRVDGPDDIDAALSWGTSGTKDLDSHELMVEQFVTGVEFSVEALSEAGEHFVVGVTGKISEHDHFVELGHVMPADITDDVSTRIHAAVDTALTALGVRDGVTHTEVIVSDDEVHIVETHLRPAGDEIPELWSRIRKVDLLDAVAKQSLGLPALAETRAGASVVNEAPAAAIWYACPDAVGELTAVDGEDEAKASPGVAAVEVLRDIGDRLEGVTGSFARAAHVCALGDTVAEALARAQGGVGAMHFTVKASGWTSQTSHTTQTIS
ncbi:ATP-grasp domain-containing protein [Aeromicrobium fastidiosum]|uniref:ATP-grasp domain-containing protein n=1 Tax=Aeromicrobium fastidiosum TaxID=52699 RepID=UPI00165F00E7|nr:ATP-grasp domain-containing protein [Aeromicrobium fastidiosum]MBP2390299.1 biotin carboxylase [Aeromicrobium fastidiosum]